LTAKRSQFENVRTIGPESLTSLFRGGGGVRGAKRHFDGTPSAAIAPIEYAKYK